MREGLRRHNRRSRSGRALHYHPLYTPTGGPLDASGHSIDHQPVSEDEYRRRLGKLLERQAVNIEQQDEDRAAQETITLRAKMHALQTRLQRATHQPVRPVRPVRPMALRRGR